MTDTPHTISIGAAIEVAIVKASTSRTRETVQIADGADATGLQPPA